jgi:hypothetical protein
MEAVRAAAGLAVVATVADLACERNTVMGGGER